jgi:hypothetical protein
MFMALRKYSPAREQLPVESQDRNDEGYVLRYRLVVVDTQNLTTCQAGDHNFRMEKLSSHRRPKIGQGELLHGRRRSIN